MKELCYDPYSVAYFVVSQKMGEKTKLDFLGNLYREEYEYIHPSYKRNKKRFVSEVLFWSNYMIDKDVLDEEFPVIKKDFESLGRLLKSDNIVSERTEIDMYFLLLRLRIVYSDGHKYTRMKLRTLLKHYGYKRRTEKLNTRIRECLLFYHIQTCLRGEQECDIETIKLDDMITFSLL